jgi:hypothetical protein
MKETSSYIEKDKKQKKDDVFIKYLRMPHEVTARFAQASNKLDMDNYDSNNLMKLVKDFSENFYGWNQMNNKTKKKMAGETPW